MAEINVKNQSAKQTSDPGRQDLQRQESGKSMSRSQGWDPWGSSLTPGGFFSGNPFTMMRRMSEEMDRMFANAFGHGGGTSSGSWYPAIEVAEHSGQLQVRAELPGLKPEDVKVEITDDALVIRGERKYEQEQQTGTSYRSERRYGEFYREIPLPEGVKTDQAKAQFRDGILEISVPIPEQASRRREIPIQSGETSGTATQATAAGQRK